jgi:hypothetical protein
MPAPGRFPLIFLIVWVTRLSHPLGAVDARIWEGSEEARFLVVFSVWFLRTFRTECLPERVKGLALTSRVVARQLRVDIRKIVVFTANMSTDP